jgi:hypothetical protein
MPASPCKRTCGHMCAELAALSLVGSRGGFPEPGNAEWAWLRLKLGRGRVLRCDFRKAPLSSGTGASRLTRTRATRPPPGFASHDLQVDVTA